MGFSQQIYNHSPVWLQNLGVSLYGWVWNRRRFGGVFQRELQGYQEREKFSPQQWENYQTEKLRSLLSTALRGVPYYKKTLAPRIADAETFSLKDLSRLPLLEKEAVRKSPEEFINQDLPRKGMERYLSSGTTGTPLAVYFTEEMHQQWSAAYEARCRLWAGVNRSMSRAMIGGRLVVPKAHASAPFWRYNAAEKQLYMSAFHISPENARYYVQALNHYKPDYLVGYAYSHYSLARMIRERKLAVHSPKAILTSSEKLAPEMRETLESVYRCKVFDAYSGVEACCLASECDHHRLHISPEVGIVELLDGQGNPVPPGKSGEITATGLLNFVQPLIRYRTGDYAVFSEEPCPCGRRMPVLKELIGRLEDAVVTQDGREMVRFHGIFVGLSYVREGQVIQENLNEIRLKLVTEPGFGDPEKKIIAKRFEERLGNVKLTFELVDTIEKTERGKFRAVISKVKRA